MWGAANPIYEARAIGSPRGGQSKTFSKFVISTPRAAGPSAVSQRGPLPKADVGFGRLGIADWHEPSEFAPLCLCTVRSSPARCLYFELFTIPSGSLQFPPFSRHRHIRQHRASGRPRLPHAGRHLCGSGSPIYGEMPLSFQFAEARVCPNLQRWPRLLPSRGRHLHARPLEDGSSGPFYIQECNQASGSGGVDRPCLAVASRCLLEPASSTVFGILSWDST